MPVATKKALSKKTAKITKAMQTAKPMGKKTGPLGGKKPAPIGKAAKRVYSFGAGKGDGDGSMKPLLGGKGANLAEMSRIGLPVPPGFTITTEVCTYFYDNARTYPPELDAQMHAGVAAMEKIMGTQFGDPVGMPMLVAVRSGARDSMPGMMDTILNLGLNDQSVLSLAKATGNERFAYDCYRRFIQMYGDVVMGVQKLPGEDHEPFEVVIETLKHDLHHDGSVEDTAMSTDDLKELVERFKKLVKDRTGKQFPNDPWEQLTGAVGAVFGSWMNDRAIVYRQKYNIPAEWGTAVNVQAMVFGNTGENSGSGVAFTRDPATGEKVFYGEFLMNAQGEDVVAGVRTPDPVALLQGKQPKAFAELAKVRKTLEAHFKDVQDFEFTIQDGKLYMLQTRNGKRTAMAAVRIAIEMTKEKLIDWQTAVTRVPSDQLDQLLAPIFDRKEEADAEVLAKGLPAGPGAAAGKIYFNADRAVEAAAKGEKVLLVRVETSPEDLRGMIAAEGILTARGGVSSHAALVARQMGKVCVCGAADVEVDYGAKTCTIKGHTFKEGDSLSINGTSGNVYAGSLKTAPSEIVQVLIGKTMDASESPTYQNFAQLMKWCGQVTRMTVRTNADNPEQTANALAFGAVGIGLCRTEHMFFEGDRIDAMREMILADTLEDRKAALEKILPYQREDFAGMFKELKGLPATIRFLDPPLHEFLPHAKKQQEELAHKMGIKAEQDPHPRRAAARVQPDARLPRVPARHQLPGDHRHAGPGRLRGRRRRDQGRRQVQARDHDPAGRVQEGVRPPGRHRPRRRQGRAEAEKGVKLSYQRRHDDRGPAGRADGRQDRRDGRVLQLRHQRPDADHAGHEPGRQRVVPARVRRAGDRHAQPVRHHRRQRRRPADGDGRREGPPDPARHQARHLRRARRRPGVGRVLPPDRPRLRQLQPLPRADRPPRRRPGRRQGRPGRREGEEVSRQRRGPSADPLTCNAADARPITRPGVGVFARCRRFDGRANAFVPRRHGVKLE